MPWRLSPILCDKFFGGLTEGSNRLINMWPSAVAIEFIFNCNSFFQWNSSKMKRKPESCGSDIIYNFSRFTFETLLSLLENAPILLLGTNNLFDHMIIKPKLIRAIISALNKLLFIDFVSKHTLY